MLDGVARLLVGTSGYSYPDWVGPVYPPGTRQEEYLGLYARRFDFVELNFSYYRQPDPGVMEKLQSKVGEEFRFATKAHRSLTHERQPDFAAEARRFREGIAPLERSGRLAAVLLQFPFSFHYDEQSRRYLDRLCRTLEGLPLAVEFRNRDWSRESVRAELERRNVALVSTDLPPLPELPSPELLVTSPLAYVRFHGRNSTAWWTGDSASRYDYRYSAAELDEWARRMLDVLKTLGVMIVAFNNHYRGQAVANALELKERLAPPTGTDAASAGG